MWPVLASLDGYNEENEARYSLPGGVYTPWYASLPP